MKKLTKHNAVVTNATAVTALSTAERGLGFLYRIALSRLIGAEGMGLYQVALSLFALFLTIGTGGIPITVSRMISKSKAERRPEDEASSVSAGIALSLILTLPVGLFLLFFGHKFPFLFSDERAFRVFRILLFGLCFSSIYAVFRGYFWGNKEFLLPSILEIAEETVMVIVGILLLQNVPNAAVGAEKAAWAVVISYLFSFTASTLCYFFKKGRLSNPKKQLKPLFNATLPITSVRASGSFINSAVAILLPIMLVRAGFHNGEALSLFGIVTGMVMPILFIPATVIGSLSLVLVPELSEDFYRKNFTRLRKNIERGIGFSFLIACFLLPLFFAVGEDLGRLAFSNPKAGEMIVKSCFLLLPMSLTMISTSILNSIGFEKQTFTFYFIGAGAMLLCVLFLPALFGVYAYVIGLGISYVVTSACNLLFLYKQCHFFKKRWHHVCVHAIFPVFITILPSSLLGKFLNLLLSSVCGEVLSIFISSIITALFLLIAYLWIGVLPSPFKNKKNERKNSFSPFRP